MDPRFETPIQAGNVFEMLGTARRYMKQLGCEKAELDQLTSDVMSADSYRDACDAIGKWFPVVGDEDNY